MKQVLIFGKDSYIGTSVEQYIKNQDTDISITVMDALTDAWRQEDFSKYDSIFQVAGIAHADVGNVSEEEKKQYYAVNCDLALEVAAKAKKAGVKQFIYPSSVIIYGDSTPYGKSRQITSKEKAAPANFYGDSKWQADKKLQEMSDDKFRVAIARLPMVYGKNSKGNYTLLSKIAKKMCIFPKVKNQRSILYIENLCEFVKQLIEFEDAGIFYPQNSKYVSTADIVECIARCNKKKMCISSLFNPGILILSKFPGKIGKIVNKAFGSCAYASDISVYRDNSYQKYTFEESIYLTEGKQYE